MHCLGNDFVVLNAITQKLSSHPDLILKIADRKQGIGCDQVLVLNPPITPDADFSYRIFNANGSEAEQCGNGACCLAKYFLDKQLKVSKRPYLIADCLGGRVTLEPEQQPNNADHPLWIRLSLTGLTEALLSKEKYKNHSIYCVKVGNPHAVIIPTLQSNLPMEESLEDFYRYAESLQHHPHFPGGINIHWGHLDASKTKITTDCAEFSLQLWPFERGVGPTLACGSGAMAASLVLSYQFAPTLDNCQVNVHFPQGILRVAHQKSNHTTHLSAVPKTSFVGQLKL